MSDPLIDDMIAASGSFTLAYSKASCAWANRNMKKRGKCVVPFPERRGPEDESLLIVSPNKRRDPRFWEARDDAILVMRRLVCE